MLDTYMHVSKGIAAKVWKILFRTHYMNSRWMLSGRGEVAMCTKQLVGYVWEGQLKDGRDKSVQLGVRIHPIWNVISS